MRLTCKFSLACKILATSSDSSSLRKTFFCFKRSPLSGKLWALVWRIRLFWKRCLLSWLTRFIKYIDFDTSRIVRKNVLSGQKITDSIDFRTVASFVLRAPTSASENFWPGAKGPATTLSVPEGDGKISTISSSTSKAGATNCFGVLAFGVLAFGVLAFGVFVRTGTGLSNSESSDATKSSSEPDSSSEFSSPSSSEPSSSIRFSSSSPDSESTTGIACFGFSRSNLKYLKWYEHDS